MTKSLGKLERVELHDEWPTENKDFTPWLAQESNLKLLAETIGMELELEAQEKNVGPFRADILCKSMDDDTWVLIENQIEKTDHRHLGQLLTYAAGLQAVTIVWIASKFTEEHRAALDWLNKITDESFRFFGLEVELWRIGDSARAPKFNIISKPNNWSKSISQEARRMSEQAMTVIKKLQLHYWQQFQEYIRSNGPESLLKKPLPQHWQTFSVGKGYFHIGALLNTVNNRIGVELCIRDPEHAKSFFNILAKDKIAIEKEIGAKLEWKELPEKTSSKIIQFKDADPKDESDWPTQHAWLKEKIEKFDKAFRKRLPYLDPEQWDSEEDAP